MDINLTNKDGVKLKTAGKYCAEDINVIPQLDTATVTPAKGQQVVQPSNNKIGFSSVTVEAIPDDYIIPSGTQQITENGTYDVSAKANAVVNVPTAKPEQTKTVDLAMASGNQVVTPDSGKVLTQVTINKPSTLVAGNIKSGVSIGGVTGTLEAAKEEQTKTVEITSNGSFTVTPDSGKVLSEVTGTVNVPTSGGGADLNIAYGDTAPSDTSKLWIKSTKPENIDFSYLIDGYPMGYSALSVALPHKMRHHPVAMVGTKIYVFGSSYLPKKNIHVFDVATNTVSTLQQTFDYSMDEGQAVTIGNKIYVLSCDKSSMGYYMYEYNPETNVLTQQKYFTAGGSSAMIAFENQIYTIGGTATNDYPHKFVYRYDPVGKAIITVGTLTNSLHKACSVSYGRYIYAFGGRSYQNNQYVPQLKVIRLNVDTSEIVELDAAFTEEVYDMVALKLGKDIYIMGSYGKAANIYHFDAETETLNPTPLSGVGFVNKTGVRGVQYGNVLYCMGGGETSAASDAGIGKFVGTIPLNQNDILVHEGETSSNYFELLPAPTRVQIGVRNVYKGNASNKAEFVDAYIHNGTNWVNVNTGEVTVDGYTVTISMREQGAYDTYANVYVDDGTSAVQYSSSSPVTVKANSKIYIDAAVEGYAVGWDGTFRADVTGGVTLTASDSSTATFAVTGDGTIVTNGITD